MLLKLYKKLKKIKKNIFSNNKDVSYWIEKIIENQEMQIVQIGSNDGRTGDPIFNLLIKNDKWNALFVEPIPYLFEKLKQNYTNDKRFKFDNVAINDGTSQLFYYVDKDAIHHENNLPNWYDQLGTFNKKHIINQLNGRLEKHILEMQINGITFENLLLRNKIENIDFLHIDAEGYDWKILSQLDLNTYNPIIILFEHKHLSVFEKESAVTFLKSKYTIYDINDDFLCVKKDYLDKNIKLKIKQII